MSNYGQSKIKGKTLDELATTKEGRDLLRWVADQPVAEGQYKNWTVARNNYIGQLLMGSSGKKDDTELEVLKSIDGKLDQIIFNTKNIHTSVAKEWPQE